MLFEWDEQKAARNLEKHGIGFDDAIEIFAGPVLEVRSDRDGEERYQSIGVAGGREISVIYTPRPTGFRIISARRAGHRERSAYRQAVAGG